jgi:hypothetical protein
MPWTTSLSSIDSRLDRGLACDYYLQNVLACESETREEQSTVEHAGKREIGTLRVGILRAAPGILMQGYRSLDLSLGRQGFERRREHHGSSFLIRRLEVKLLCGVDNMQTSSTGSTCPKAMTRP